jgi:hypothetical protein
MAIVLADRRLMVPLTAMDDAFDDGSTTSRRRALAQLRRIGAPSTPG